VFSSSTDLHLLIARCNGQYVVRLGTTTLGVPGGGPVDGDGRDVHPLSCESTAVTRRWARRREEPAPLLLADPSWPGGPSQPGTETKVYWTNALSLELPPHLKRPEVEAIVAGMVPEAILWWEGSRAGIYVRVDREPVRSNGSTSAHGRLSSLSSGDGAPRHHDSAGTAPALNVTPA
jgi:hypothetical protein